jgi:hypothetical protein
MQKSHGTVGWFCLLIGSAMLVIAGCNSEPIVVEEELSETKSRLMDIKFAYMGFLEKTRRPPRNEKDLRRTLETDNPDEAFLSPRDGEPFVICYGVNIFGPLEWAESTPVIAYEKQGDGTRWVLSAPGAIYELDEEEFQKASFPPGHTVQ